MHWGRPLKYAELKELDEMQRVNHFPGGTMCVCVCGVCVCVCV